MFRKMSLGTKMILGFGILLGLISILSGKAVLNMKGIEAQSHQLADEYVPEVELSNNLERYSMEAMLSIRSYGLTLDGKLLDQGREHLGTVKKYVDELKKLSQSSAHLVKLKGVIGTLESNLREFDRLITETEKAAHEGERSRVTLNADAKAFTDACNAYLHSQEEHMRKDIKEDVSDEKKFERLHKIDAINNILEAGENCRLIVWKSQALRNPAMYSESEPHFVEMDKLFDEIRKITRIEADLAALELAAKSAHHYKETMNLLKQSLVAMDEIGRMRAIASHALVTSSRDISLAGIKHTLEIAEQSSASLSATVTENLIGLLIAMVLGLSAAVYITRSITAPLKEIFKGLKSFSTEELQDTGNRFKSVIDALVSGAAHVATASSEVSQSSQTMASGASEQASSLEETSASLEEMSSMTKQNADSARECNAAAELGKAAMQRMSLAIHDIKKILRRDCQDSKDHRRGRLSDQSSCS